MRLVKLRAQSDQSSLGALLIGQYIRFLRADSEHFDETVRMLAHVSNVHFRIVAVQFSFSPHERGIDVRGCAGVV